MFDIRYSWHPRILAAIELKTKTGTANLHPEGIGVYTNQFDLIGPEGRHNFCRGLQAPERIIQDSRALKVATQCSERGVFRRLRGSFMIVLVIRGLTAPAMVVSALRAC